MSETDKNKSSGKDTATDTSAANGRARTATSTARRTARDTTRAATDGAGEAGKATGGVLATQAQALTSTVNGVWRKAAVPALGLLKANAVTAGGVAAAATAVAVGAYAGGRRSVLRAHGPVTRLTGGRI
ncbi:MULTISPECIES: hypothetical protein [Streptomyces]|uniref:Uncharacterized protein n=2 Tax=Streptomyces TaxID=1883 RepID=A0A100Y982_9ACTN|nr:MULTISPECIES: hypothetical protein [Streptomyces]KUH40024.1 hypothetical protein ATE80_04375 [Streptomyces kanasensis]UUS29566.1 hypothetical protein NRO40_01100 [Streptomyces changanensis]